MQLKLCWDDGREITTMYSIETYLDNIADPQDRINDLGGDVINLINTAYRNLEKDIHPTPKFIND